MIRLPSEGETFGRYRLLRKLGQGGMGVVFAALDTSLDREVAVKLVAPHLADDEGFRARFQHEAAVLARLESPRIVRIYDHGEQDGVLFIVTQLVDGGDLLKLIHREGALPPALAMDVLAQTVQGLVDAHAVGVVHRDIKPANVLLRSRGREFEAFLCDFGIATTAGADLSRTGTVAGSLPYMAPERHQGEDAGPQGDVYAAGCLLWHALTGAAPYAGTDVEVAMAHLQAPVPQLPGRDEFSKGINEVLRRALAKKRAKRYPTARAMLAELTRVAALAPDAISLPGATAVRRPLALQRSRVRRWAPAAVAVLATAAVLVTTVVAGGAIGDRDREVAEPPVLTPDPTLTGAGGGAPGAQINERPTLVPDGSPRKAPTWEPDKEATNLPGLGPGIVLEDPPVADDDRSATPRKSSAPKPERRKKKRRPGGGGGVDGGTRDNSPRPQPTKTVTETPTPVNHYRCWNGDEVPAYSGCTRPISWRGANYIYPGIPKLSGCHAFNGPRGARESWICHYRADGHNDNWVAFNRWGNVRRAKNYYHGWFRKDFRHKEAWAIRGMRYGLKIRGRAGKKGNWRWRVVRIYENEPWSLSVSAATKRARNKFYSRYQGYRNPTKLRGYRYQ